MVTQYVLMTMQEFVLWVVLPAATAGFIAWFVPWIRLPVNAKMIIYCKRKKMRMLLHIGLDRAMHFLPATRGINGDLHVGPLGFKPDPTNPDASFPLGNDNVICMITHAHSASTLNPEFLEYTQFTTKNLSKSQNPREAAVILKLMMQDEQYTNSRLQLFKQIYNGEKTFEEVKQQEALRLRLDENSKTIFFQEIERAYGYSVPGDPSSLQTEEEVQKDASGQVLKEPKKNTKGEIMRDAAGGQIMVDVVQKIPIGIKKLENHLAEIQKAKMITVEKRNWSIQPYTDKKTGQSSYQLVELVEVPIDRVKYFLPNGANPNDVHSYEANKEAQNINEREEGIRPLVKYMVIGFVALLMGVGVYVILQGLHI